MEESFQQTGIQEIVYIYSAQEEGGTSLIAESKDNSMVEELSLKKNSITLQYIVDKCGGLIDEVCGKVLPMKLYGVTSWSDADTYTVSWINRTIEERQKVAEGLQSKVVVCGTDIEYTHVMKETGKVLLKSAHPRLLIIKISSMFVEKVMPYIAPSAVIDKDAVISNGCYIGHNCVIGKCVVGENTMIRDGAIICDNVQIGCDCNINYSSVIGCSCSGIERDLDYKLISFPHFSSVIIGDRVNIGVRTTIVKGVLTPTTIGDGSTIDSHCIIGHNTNIGEDVYIASDSCINGSVKIGKGVTIFSKSTVAEWIRIGEYSVIGQASLVRCEIPSYEMWFGHPAKFNRRLTEKFLPFE